MSLSILTTTMVTMTQTQVFDIKHWRSMQTKTRRRRRLIATIPRRSHRARSNLAPSALGPRRLQGRDSFHRVCTSSPRVSVRHTLGRREPGRHVRGRHVDGRRRTPGRQPLELRARDSSRGSRQSARPSSSSSAPRTPAAPAPTVQRARPPGRLPACGATRASRASRGAPSPRPAGGGRASGSCSTRMGTGRASGKRILGPASLWPWKPAGRTRPARCGRSRPRCGASRARAALPPARFTARRSPSRPGPRSQAE